MKRLIDIEYDKLASAISYWGDDDLNNILKKWYNKQNEHRN